MKIKMEPFGDRAILISFKSQISRRVNRKVWALEGIIKKANFEWLVEMIPAYHSLTVIYNPWNVSYEEAKKDIDLLDFDEAKHIPRLVDPIEIPVCYEDQFALDKETVIHNTGATWEEIVGLHSLRVYHIFMIGFVPGFPYLGPLPSKLSCPRKVEPRIKVPGGSVAIAGFQTGIYPVEIPGGWQIIGRTPIRIFDPRQENPFVLTPGGRLKFVAIDSLTFKELNQYG